MSTEVSLRIVDKGDIYYYDVSVPSESERFDNILKKKVVHKFNKSFKVTQQDLTDFPEATLGVLNTQLGTNLSVKDVVDMIEEVEARRGGHENTKL